MRFLTTFVLSLLLFCFISCSSDNKKDSADATAKAEVSDKTGQTTLKIENYEMSGIPFDLNGKPVSIAGITFVPATQWQDLGASNMRMADYTYGPLENDVDSATLSVFYFGESNGGSIEANLDRWIRQMSFADGRDPHKSAIQNQMVVEGMNVHIVTVLGNYNAPVGGMMSAQTVSKENYRLIGAVVEAPEGNVFFKLTGPEYTARIMTEAFITMIKQIKKN